MDIFCIIVKLLIRFTVITSDTKLRKMAKYGIIIKSRINIDLSEEDRYEAEYEKLLRNIYKKPLHRKPALGQKPEWLENEKVDLSPIRDLIKQIRGYNGGNTTKTDFLIRRSIDNFTTASMSYTLLDEKPFDEALLILIDEVKPLRDLFIDYIEALLYVDLDVGEIIPMMFENFYNSTFSYIFSS